LKGIDKRKRAANIIGNEDIGMAGLNMRKESKFLDERINRMRLAFLIAYIDRLSDIRIFKN
jgi:uncharacterized protein (UPF0305 family)